MEVEKNQRTDGANDHYLVEHNRVLKCICELCSCGKHQCPRPRIKGSFTTEYNECYKNIKIVPTKDYKEELKYEQRHYNPESLKTSYQEAYVPQSIPNGGLGSRLETYGGQILKKIPFIGQSSYKEEYKPYIVKSNQNPEDQEANLPINTPFKMPVRPSIKFEGVTSYRSHYVSPPKMDSRVIPEPQIERTQIPFYGNSTYKEDFPGYKILAKQKSFEFNHSSATPPIKFEGSSTYKDQYRSFRIKTEGDYMGTPKHVCIVEKLHVPTINYINNQNHIFYDPESKKFV